MVWKDSVCVLILGMHRSGTSAFTRVLNLLGVDLGTILHKGDLGNPSGYWEAAEFVKYSNELLTSINSSWDDWTQNPEKFDQENEISDYFSKTSELILQTFNGSTLFAVKDPRLCRLIPLWRDILNELEVQPICLLPIRNPMEVAASLKKRDGFPSIKSELLWLRYVLDAEYNTRNLPRMFAEYGTLLTNWETVASKFSHQFNLNLRYDDVSIQKSIDDFLQDSYHTHRFSDDELYENSMVLDWVKNSYRNLKLLINDDGNVAVYKELDVIRENFNIFSTTFGPLFLYEQSESLIFHTKDLNIKISKLDMKISKLEQIIENNKHQMKLQKDRMESQKERIENQKGRIDKMKNHIENQKEHILSLRKQTGDNC